MAVLAPLLSSEHRAGDQAVTIPGRHDRFVVNSKGVLEGRGTSITSRDPKTGRPTAASARDRESALEVLASSMTPGCKVEESYELPVTGRAERPPCHLVTQKIELAVLKTGLLTFDEQLRTHHHEPFTRSSALASMRRAVRDVIRDGVDASDLLRTVALGIQYEKLDLLRGLRGQTLFPSTDFEHMLVVSANPPTRTLDLVVWLFGIDPYGFRLSTVWRGDGFTFVVVNGVRKGSQASRALELGSTDTLCRATRRRSNHIEEIISVRSDAVQRALYLSMKESDWFVRRTLYNAMLPSPDSPVEIESALRDRLEAPYEQRLKDPTSRAEFDRIFAKNLGDLPGEIRNTTVRHEAQRDGLPWDLLVTVFREIVDQLVPFIGLPGEPSYEPTATDVTDAS